MSNNIPTFIVIDDDPINNMICTEFINLTVPGAEIKTFTSPEKGLEYLSAQDTVSETKTLVLFLDVNMPAMSGWEVLDKLDGFPASLKERMRVFMLSSSVDQQDKERASGIKMVLGYITKFLSQEKITALFPIIGMGA